MLCFLSFPPKNLMKVLIFGDWPDASRIKIQKPSLIFLVLVLSKIGWPLVGLICCLMNCSLQSGQGGKTRRLIEIKNRIDL